MKDGGNVRGLNTAATLWCSAAVGACAGAGEMLDAVFVTVLLIAINIVLRPLSRFIDQRSLVSLDVHTLYRLRLICSNADKTVAEQEITRAVAERSLVLRELRAEQLEETRSTIVQAVLESSTRDPVIMTQLADEIRALPCTESVDWTATSRKIELGQM